MTKILEEVREISSNAIAKKQDAAKNKMPDLIKQIKGAAALGKTSCEFPEYAMDEYSKELLQKEGFRVYATTKENNNDYLGGYTYKSKFSNIWVVSW